MAVILLVSSVGLGWVMMDYQQFADSPVNIQGQPRYFEISSGDTLKKVSRQLYQQGLINNPRYLVWMARFDGTANHIKIGEYQFSQGITPTQLLDKIVRGETIQYSATIIEGMTFRELLMLLAGNENLEHTLTGLDTKQIMSRLGYEGQHPEGRFLPDTYLFPRGTTDVQYLQRAWKAMEEVLKTEWAQREFGSPLKTEYEALILASIVEKETAVPEERSQIAGVFTRRLQKKMRLQTDPTVIYGMGEKYHGNIRRRDLKQNTPYNTYLIKGLPPTPIAMPGRDAIRAAINPAQGEELYFVAKGDGSHVFTANLRDHNNAVIKYQLKGKRRAFSSMPKARAKK